MRCLARKIFETKSSGAIKRAGRRTKTLLEKHDVILAIQQRAELLFQCRSCADSHTPREASTERLQNKANVFRGDKVYPEL